MTNENKQQIVAAANTYLAAHGLSQNEMARKSGINQGYLSLMLKGQFITMAGDKETPIGDKWFVALANTIGLSIEKNYWQTIPTPQFSRIIASLEDYKENCRCGMLIGETGCGKTYATDIYCKKNPHHTYRITVSALYRLNEIINELTEMLGIEVIHGHRSSAFRVQRIVKKLSEIKANGGKPQIIIDEGENLRVPALGMLKSLYDGLNGIASIVIIGTTELEQKLLKLKQRNQDGIPQLYRRFKAGTVKIEAIDRQFKRFLDLHVNDAGLRRLLQQLCDNYGELHDYLQPALMRADRDGVALTEDYFRLMYNLPKYK